MLIAKGERVKPSTLAKVRDFFSQRETQNHALQRPGSKRKWEREHREERNARRRKYMSSHSSEPSGRNVPLPDPNLAQVPVTIKNGAIGGMKGLALLLTALILVWRLGSSIDPVAGA